VDEKSTMATIQVVIDAKLLKAANLAAKRGKTNRSALIRSALEAHLKRLKILELEEQERLAYIAQPQKPEEYRGLEAIAAWPDD
jgi:metal-responsive CopG/Arc/MetJ family transcriptional regulator